MDTSSSPLIGLDQFLEKVTEIQQLNQSWKDNLERTRNNHRNLLSIGWSHKSREQQTSQFETLKSQNKEYQKKISEEIRLGWSRHFSKPHEEKIRKEQMKSLTEQFQETIMESKKLDIRFESKLKEQFVKIWQITGDGKLSEEEILDKLNSNQIEEFQCQGILTETEEARKKKEEITDRHNQLKQLEHDIQELRDLFKETEDYVKLQGVVIEAIEEKVEHAREDVSRGTKLLGRAKSYWNKVWSKKKLLGILMASLVLLLLIVIIATSDNSTQPSSTKTEASSSSSSSTEIVTTPSTTTTSKDDRCDPDDPFCVG